LATDSANLASRTPLLHFGVSILPSRASPQLSTIAEQCGPNICYLPD
jgi:hypothetical protein